MEKSRNKGGKPRHIKTTSELWEWFLAYKQHCIDNPIAKTHFVGKDGRREYEDIPTPITYKGFQVFLWENEVIRDLQTYEKDEEYSPIIARIKGFCEVHNVKYALSGHYKENLVARIHGIKEQTETDNKHTIQEVKIDIKRSE